MPASNRVAYLVILLLLSPTLALGSCVCEEPACTEETKTCMKTSCDPRCGDMFGFRSCKKSCQECLGKSPAACGKAFGDCRPRCSAVDRTCHAYCFNNNKIVKCPADCHEAMLDCVTKCANPV